MPTVVGIGASAEGLGSLKSFLENVPGDSGLALLVMARVAEAEADQLAAWLQPHVRFPVELVRHTTLLEPNRAYIVPPNARLQAIDTHVRWSGTKDQRQGHAPIDHFFRTLASTCRGQAIAVLLAGHGADGALGVQDIKASGGMVIVQDPAGAEDDGILQSAIATGMVDLVLPVAEIPGRILRIDKVRPRIPLSPETEGASQGESYLLRKAYSQLHVQTGRDFSRYKRATILRRIARRMQLNHLENLAAYVEMLQDRPEEVHALADDLLITITRFFRDPEVFDRLAQVELKRLFARKGRTESVRVWSVGCATGEEAYSLAMLVCEESERHEAPPHIRVFGTDLNSRSLEKAREGFYPGDLTTDVSPERLERFFQQEHGGYRVRRELRDLVVFAPHNLLSHPPFSNLDLISCRNLLIYLERPVQQDVIELFHYALNPDGLLMLGSAESVQPTDLFRTEDKELCLFRKRSVTPRMPKLPVFPLTRTRFQDGGNGKTVLAGAATGHGPAHQRLVEKHARPSMLVGGDNRVLHLSEHVGRYLLTPEGVPTQNALKMVREELRLELQAGLQEVRANRTSYDSRPIAVRFDDELVPVVLRVRPSLEREEEDFALVIFEEREALNRALEAAERDGGASQEVAILREDVKAAQQRNEELTEEHEIALEEIRAADEELQSTREELRSTMEELETSRQELQSFTQELQAVNRQNRHIVSELGQLSNDLQNLLIATDIATLFLDRNFRILRFTPKLGELFNIRVTDRGRPISDLTHRLGYTNLCGDAETVLSSAAPVERELKDDAGRWYLTRLHPYRDNEDRIDGVVITFVDITDRKDGEQMRLELLARQQSAASEKALRKKEGELARVSRTLMVGELATSIAHEVNQPLAGVITNAQAALRWLEGGPPNLTEVRNSLSSVIRDGNRASLVIRRVREFVKNESSPAEVLNIGEILRETMALLQFDLEQKGVALSLEIPEELPPIQGDRIQLEQVILNLLINAVESMAETEGQPSELSVSVQNGGEEGVVVSIRDTGIGMDPKQIDRIFDSFFTTKKTGVGMGLSICRSIIEAHGGSIWATSNDGPGLTVQFRLPLDGAKTQ
ncbi:MAG: PAS domain-containing protein [Acidobacteria bacterium]|nr:PAS domain-containing protein [Acidobacteriota bacterium]